MIRPRLTPIFRLLHIDSIGPPLRRCVLLTPS